MNDINFDSLKEIDEYKSILALNEEARNFLESQKWCIRVLEGWYDSEFGIYEKLGVFLFEIEPSDDTVDKFVWVILGDVPTVYLDESVKTGKEALEIYCELMEEWSDNIFQGISLEECYPVEAEATKENAELLKKRIAFIRTQFQLFEDKKANRH